MFSALFLRFESRIQATATPPPEAPPPGLLAFYWHFVRQARGLFAAMLLSCLLVALSDTVLPGRTTGTWCGKAGRFFRTTSPAALPTG